MKRLWEVIFIDYNRNKRVVSVKASTEHGAIDKLLDHYKIYDVLDVIEVKKKNKCNPVNGAVEIYGRLEAIEAQKGKDSLWPGEKFRHTFKGRTNARVFGLPNGDILIKSKNKKRLWKSFSGYKKGIDYK